MAKRRHNSFIVLLFVLAFLLLLLPDIAMAQVDLKDSTGSFDGLLDLVQKKANTWDEKLRFYATRLFWLLASIQFIWTFFPLVFKQADFGEIIGEMIRFIMVTGFFLALLMFSAEWGTAVVDSFREAGGAAAGYGKPLKPGDIFGVAVDLSFPINNANDTFIAAEALAQGATLVTDNYVRIFPGSGLVAGKLAAGLIETRPIRHRNNNLSHS